MRSRLNSGDYRFLGICFVLLAVTVWFSARNFYRAFPEASIDFKVNREDARAAAARFLTSQGYRLEGYRDAGQFAYDDEAKTFLERELGLEQANRILGSQVRLWRWSNRWFRPLQKEEFTADITPRGELAGFEHSLPDDAARPDATAAEARRIAEDFLRSRIGRDPAAMDFVESSEVVRLHRTDRTYTWKLRDFDLHDATYRYEVAVLGNEAGGYREYLKIPEQWTRDYQKLRSRNQAASVADGAVTLLLAVGMIVVIVMRVRKHDIHWRQASLFGITGMVLAFLSQLNEFPLQEFSYPTTDSYGSFVSRQLLNAVLSALGSGGLLFLLAAGAEPLYREMFGGQVAVGNLFTMRGLRTKRFFLGAILGITLTGIFVAYQTGFYIWAYKWGAWSPADVPYSDLLNTKFPWAFVLFGGFLPAVSEEFLFRLFAIPFLRKLTRSWLAALVLAGFIWGFGHSAYPQQPFFIRGVEVGIGGIALGLVMLRWGILPTLVWHYSVDAMYSAMLLVRSENLYLKLSGAAAAGIVVLPAAVALILYWKNGGFESAEGLLNSDQQGSAEAPEASAAAEHTTEPAAIAYRPLSPTLRWCAVALLLAGAAFMAIPVSRFGRQPVYRLSAAQALKASDEFLKGQGMDLSRFQHVTYPGVHWDGPDELAGKYFLERMPLEKASGMFERYRPVRHWVTRYFRPLDREEMSVSVHPETGRVRGVGHTIPEDRPGADLTEDRAREIAQKFAADLGYDLTGMELKENASEKRKARRDYRFVWEARPGDPRNVGETKWRVTVEVAGDRAVSGGGMWKPPESFERARERQNAISIAVAVMRIVLSAGLVVWALWLLVQGIRSGSVHWLPAIRLSLPAMLIFPVGALLSIHLMVRNYNTAEPFETFQAVTWIGLAMSVLLGCVMLVAAAAFINTFYPEALPALRRGQRRLMGLDAAAALLAAIGLGMLVLHFEGLLTARFPALALPDFNAPDLIVSRAPALSALAAGVRSWLLNAAGLGLVVLLVRHAPARWMAWTGALLAAIGMVSGDVRTAAEFAVQYAEALISMAAVAIFCVWFARKNWLAYALALWVAALRGPLAELFGNQNPSLASQGWIVVVVLGVSVLWAIAPGLSRQAAVHE
jgi:membrane protease YdiL (CAAX protease family)